MKIAPCPVCKGHYQLNLNHWQEHDDPDVCTCYQVQCSCGYSSELCYSRNEAAIAHNRHCELVRLGRMAKEIVKDPPIQRTSILTNQSSVDGYNLGVAACLNPLKTAMEEK